ncbi:MAG: hypothetical protein AAFR52_14930, partial [Pseudomonadota bacterium]
MQHDTIVRPRSDAPDDAPLDPATVAQYRRDGYLPARRAMSAAEAARLRAAVEALEAGHAAGAGACAGGRELGQYFRVNGQLVIPLLADVARTPAVLDAVESLLGPDLLVWSVELFIKE